MGPWSRSRAKILVKATRPALAALPRRPAPGAPAALAALGALLAPAPALSQEAGGFRFQITETSIVNYHVDNRDQKPLNDDYGEWLNRLNVQGTRGPLTLQFRLDSAIYFAKPDPNTVARQQAADSADAIAERAKIDGVSLNKAKADFINQQTVTFGSDLSSRYVNTIYPSKITATYSKSGLDLAVGDFYTQLGRGFVLSMRKADELATDTTLRGAKIDYRPDLGKMRLNMTLLAGFTNPLRVDEVSGRQLSQGARGHAVVPGSRLEDLFFPFAPAPNQTFYAPDPQPTYSPDRIIGARIEQGVREVLVSMQGAYLHRTADFFDGNDQSTPSRNARDIVNASVGLSVPSIADHGSLYVEAAIQNLDHAYHPKESSPGTQAEQNNLLGRLSGGQALYALLTTYAGPVTVNVEAKHYNRFYPLAAGVARGTSEFLQLQYNGVPTTEPIWSDTQFNAFNACITGARVRVDVKAREGLLLYSHVGGYVSYSERVATCGQEPTLDDSGNTLPPRGKTDEIRNTIWDPWVGFEWNAHDNRSHVYGSVGTRFDNTAHPEVYAGIDNPTTTFYREYYHARYDAVRKVTGPWSVQVAGFHRHRQKSEQQANAWYDGENYLSLLYAPKLTAAFGYEYTTQFGDLKHYLNGQVLYRYTTDKTVRLFVGQSRPALRCVSGVCRQFPAFEGAKLEVVLRF